MLTDEQIQVASTQRCPKCNHGILRFAHEEFDELSNSVHRQYVCQNPECGIEFTNVYSFVTSYVEED
jgi:uncharacterized protein with PIN domain